MQIDTTPLAPGLYFVATPIGTARDITLRALDILASADVIAAEDTRTVKHLMQLHGVAVNGRPVVAYHDHSGPGVRDRLLGAIKEGKSVAYASEAGTPLVADPGYQLGRAAIEADLPVTSAPGPSAVLAALTVSGLPSDRFLFAGFAPTSSSARRKWLQSLDQSGATLVIYESPKRVGKLLTDSVQCFGEERRAVICRELTKRFEETARGTLGSLAESYADRKVKGEVVVLIDRGEGQKADAAQIEDALRTALADMSVKDAAAKVSSALNLPRRDVYQAALALSREE